MALFNSVSLRLAMHLPLSLALFSGICQANALTDWQDPEYIQRAFNEVALKNEYQKTDLRIVKWQVPIIYQLSYEHLQGPIPLIEEMAQVQMNHLASITNHAIKQSHLKDKPNFRIILTKDAYFKTTIEKWAGSKMGYLAKESNCIASFKRNQHHEIIQASVVIPVDHAMSRGLLPACIVEETTQALGLPNDSDWVNPSIANDASKLDYLTGLDYVMLKLLYDPAIKAGMSFSQSQPILKASIQKMLKDQTIQNAYQSVKTGGLYQFQTP
ncbi:DUF2927 domain-containing protein [Thiosulfativibrio zosterae]|uniref:DUF2927 domain-containing protein n=1 Tax=Thiosulfativibrio zosterae TaxID=2675053 RepID=A0A6F8PKY7_9GAMM|nr:DUF2927 domain-containing protein [Thiosulfativibrio zosterae]BBP42738.1 hypothetical protein THMIRHAT_04840 [Thiosulfativibrio zosterae]